MSHYARTLNGIRKAGTEVLAIGEKRKEPVSQAKGAPPSNELRRQRGEVPRTAGGMQTQVHYP